MTDNLSASETRSMIPVYAKHRLAVALSLVTLVLGTILPVLSGPKVPTALVNVIWGTTYGIGFFLIDVIPTVGPGIVKFLLTVFGMFVWPLLLAFSVYRVASAVMSRPSLPLHIITGIALVISFFWNMEIRQVRHSFVYYLPLYTAFMDR